MAEQQVFKLLFKQVDKYNALSWNRQESQWFLRQERKAYLNIQWGLILAAGSRELK